MKKTIFISALISFFALSYVNASNLEVQTQIKELASKLNAQISVYAKCDQTEICLNSDDKMPLFSVYKVFVATSYLKQLEKKNLSLEEPIKINYSKLNQNTYSPMLKDFNSDFELTAAQLIHYSIALSDNNANDLLMEFCGGVGQIQKDLKKAGLGMIQIAASEDEMHANLSKCYDNCCSTRAICKFYEKLISGKLLKTNETDFIIKTLYATSTGIDRLRSGIPEEINLAHKTGTGPRIQGKKLGDNDSGFFYLKNGKICYLAVFIKDSFETDKTDAAFISECSNLIFQEFNR